MQKVAAIDEQTKHWTVLKHLMLATFKMITLKISTACRHLNSDQPGLQINSQSRHGSENNSFLSKSQKTCRVGRDGQLYSIAVYSIN